MITRPNIGLFFKNIWVGILGIIAEISAVAFFIFIGFIVCFIWWSFFR